ncbi:MAG: DEAD/DEAH box helicase family protein, partial [Planctomycetaceae bacterium]|nr:DEAD/DEAH box helicase family protein [Planctomycetaceae bacterium]
GIDLSDGKRKTVAVIGPTGTGKTMTLAKIAAYFHLQEFKHTAFITVDQYRIGAVEQLAKYSEMLGCPMETVSEPYRMKTVLRKFSDMDLILLDTPGTNPRNKARLQILDALLDAAEVDEVHLVLSAVSSVAVLKALPERFAPLGPTHLTLSKLDEAVSPADIYHFLKSNKLPLRYLTTGQNISEDIEIAGAARLAGIAAS